MGRAALALGLALCGSSCVVEADYGVEEHGVVSDDARSPMSGLAQGPEQPNLCDLLPEEGPCSLACDPQALGEEYVPPGTCATFLCTLADGQDYAVHACHSSSAPPAPQTGL